ncbi:CHAT domain-containing protein [Streptomyces sp. NPDC090445]|uniref:CHAT domain-containing protein n=1 Tax=Streptomyces sp. NPDC090445 TaxID=3365963 RepID=UPI0037F13817
MTTPAPSPARILVVQASSPRIPAAPDAGAEFREIRLSVDGGRYRDAVVLEALQAARLPDVTARLIREVPAVLHFSARGTPDGGGLRFLTEDGGDAPVRDRGLAKLLCEFVGDGLRVVVLNACWTSELAGMLVEAVPCVIGTAGPIRDGECRTYSRTLYSSLAHGRSVGQSHRIAVHEAEACGADAAFLPALVSSPATIPDAVYLIGPEFRSPPVRTPVKPLGGAPTWLRFARKRRL